MHLLKIDDNKGLFLSEESKYISIEKITKEHLLRLVDLTLNNEVVFDEFDEVKLQNPAHKIVYKNIYAKLSDLESRKEEFLDASERLFLQDYEKYKQDTIKIEKE